MAVGKPDYITQAQLIFDRIVLGLVGEGRRVVITETGGSGTFINEMGFMAYLTCDKHKTWAEIGKLNPGLDEISHADIQAAANKCKQCIADAAAILPPTRFPEGAEL